ncbi:hypothetical protein ACEQ8H_007376 [Pleosporales sp. CAS-2024a]
MGSHILVIGATGLSGLEFCNAALARGHALTLYVRNPSKVPADIAKNANVSVATGTLEDVASFERAAQSGPKVFVSFAGPVSRAKGTPVTEAMKRLFPILVANDFKRAMVLCTSAHVAPQDKSALKWKAVGILIKAVGGSGFEEFKGIGTIVSAQDVSRIKWTLFRVPFLSNGPEAPTTATYAGSGGDGMSLSRKSMANWVLDELREDSAWVGKAPMLSN